MSSEYKKYFKKILWTNDEIQAKCKELANWIDQTYKDSDNLILVGLLKGCFPFFGDVMKHVKKLIRVDYMRFSSYGASMHSSHEPRLMLDSSLSLFNADVLIIDEIIDTGLTIEKVFNMINAKKPRSLKVMVLIDKKESRLIDFQPTIYGFDSPKEFLIGYGLDYNNHFRQAPYVGVFDVQYLKDDKLTKFNE